MDIKITDNRKEMAKIGRQLARLTRADISDLKYQSFWDELDLYVYTDTVEEKEEWFYAWLYDYWVYGNNLREEFFYDFINKSHEEKLKYITFCNRFEYYAFLNDADDEMIFKHKYLTYENFSKYYHRDVITISEDSDYEKFSAFVDKHPEFIVKPDNLGLGTGVHIENVSEWKQSKEERFHSILNESSDNSQLSYERKSTIVMEELIKQHPGMAKLYPNAVNIIRLTTILNGEDVDFVDAWLRIGINGNRITCASLGEIYCGVNIETGIVETRGFTEFANVYTQHPITGVKLLGYKIPHWNEVIELAKELAHNIKTVRHVGWDLALSENGWVLVEGNETGEFLGQLIYDKPYTEYLEGMINWKRKPGYWWRNNNPQFV